MVKSMDEENEDNMAESLNPRVDITFKKIFGVEENKDLLVSLINAIVSKEDQVESVEILNPYNPQNFKKDKLSVLDVKAKGHTGKRYNIEIQITDEADYDKRALYYWAKLYTEQLKATGKYKELNKAIGIHILNFTSIVGVKKYHNVFHITEKETGFHYFENLELHTIELNKFEIPQGENDAEILNALLPKIRTSLDRWATFLSRYDLLKQKNLPKEVDDPLLQKAVNVVDVMNFTPEERSLYEDHLKWLMIEASALEKRYEDGRKEEKQAIAQKLFQRGMTVDEVCELTGLSAEEIEG